MILNLIESVSEGFPSYFWIIQIFRSLLITSIHVNLKFKIWQSNTSASYLHFCRKHYKSKFDIDPGYIFQTALKISLS